jgi:hypothetical protein
METGTPSLTSASVVLISTAGALPNLPIEEVLLMRPLTDRILPRAIRLIPSSGASA